MPPKTARKETKQTVDRNERRSVTGVVTGDKMDKTIKVRVERLVQHPVFGKTLRKFYVCYAHDEKREAKAGDKVELVETRPLSRLKNWRLVRILEKSASGGGGDEARHAARPDRAPAGAPASPKA